MSEERIIQLDPEYDDTNDSPPAGVRVYNMYCECENCGYTGDQEIPKGVRVGEAECHECGCTTLIKASPVKRDRDIEDRPRQSNRRSREPDQQSMIELLRQQAIEAERRRMRDQPRYITDAPAPIGQPINMPPRPNRSYEITMEDRSRQPGAYISPETMLAEAARYAAGDPSVLDAGASWATANMSPFDVRR